MDSRISLGSTSPLFIYLPYNPRRNVFRVTRFYLKEQTRICLKNGVTIQYTCVIPLQILNVTVLRKENRTSDVKDTFDIVNTQILQNMSLTRDLFKI